MYGIEIIEDDEEESKRERKAYKAPDKKEECALKKNARMDQLTEEMKQMGVK